MTILGNIRQIINPALLMTVCTAGMLLLSCQRDEDKRPAQDCTAMVHINTDVPDTKAIADSDINSIAIFVFNDNDVLVGYLYESGLTSNTERTFPMNLTESGALDFYVIANSEPGFYHLVDEYGEVLDLSGTLDDLPEGITPDRLWNSRVERHQGTSAQGDWFIPMNNLPGSGLINFRFTVRSQSTTYIPIELSRAVSKIEVWFRSNDHTATPPTLYESPQQGVNYNPRSYYSIETLNLSMPVTSARTYTGTPEYGTRVTASQNGPFNYQNVGGFGSGFPDYDPDDIPNNFYSGDYFAKIWEFYIFPNMYGGNSAGEETHGSTDNYTILDLSYYLTLEQGYYQRQWGYYKWNSRGFIKQSNESKIIYLPACERNSNIRVWCALNDDTDRSFTYTVSDWDETVTVNVPDFE